MTSLFEAITFGAIHAPNRIMMAPLTRGRATRSHVPTPLMGEYYSQRASAGLIISEATGITQQGLGWPYAPGLWSEEQANGWKPVVRAVHEAGGRIVAQLWHMGRLVHPDYLGGAQPVSASATTAPGHAHTYEGTKPYAESRALELHEIKSIIDDYRRAAEHALAAGFDGVQLHAANGYLVDQFLRDGTNRRTDSYGGSIENRIRCVDRGDPSAHQRGRCRSDGRELSPNDDPQGCGDSDSESLFTKAARRLGQAPDSVPRDARITPRKHVPARDSADRPGHSSGVQRHADPEFGLFARRCLASLTPGRSRRNYVRSDVFSESRFAGTARKARPAQPAKFQDVLYAGTRRLHGLPGNDVICRAAPSLGSPWRALSSLRYRRGRLILSCADLMSRLAERVAAALLP